MPYHINQFNRVYQNGCVYPLPSGITIVVTYIQSVISFLILALSCSAVHLHRKSNITVNRHDLISLVGFDQNYSVYP